MSDWMSDWQLQLRIQRLQTRYVHILDEDRLEQWPALFTADGCYTITTRENHQAKLPLALYSCTGQGMLQDRVTGYRRINVYEPQCYRHQISALEVEADPAGGWRCRSNFLVVRTLQRGDMSVFATGSYRDRIVEQDGELRFVERLVITDSRQTDTLLVIPL
ncbi:MAG: aromatic-ring-hydroxylating dioxygenase subunit beta [Pseudomonadales bacterium]|jgi:anthranilate 1,2-dioxygenase small subunit|nr:aromatic-ring-hydroxylating dioxygenase subunit beta [Pseudomonadales bacterium]